MVLLPKLFRHSPQSQSDAQNANQPKSSPSKNSSQSSSSENQATLPDPSANSHYLLQPIDDCTLSILSFSDNHVFLYKLDSKILQVTSNRERENYFLVLCSPNIIHLIKIANTTSQKPLSETVQIISSFKLPNISSIEWHPLSPQQFITSSSFDVSIWNLQQLNSLKTKDSSAPLELTLDLISQYAKVLSLASLYSALGLKASKSRRVRLLPSSSSSFSMALLIDDKFLALLSESTDSSDGSTSLIVQKYVQLDRANTSSAFNKTFIIQNELLCIVYDEQLVTYSIDGNYEYKFSNESLQKSSVDDLISDSEDENSSVIVSKISPKNVLKLPFKPTHAAAASNNIFIAKSSYLSNENMKACLIEVPGFSLRLLKTSLDASVLGLAGSSSFYLSFIPLTSTLENTQTEFELLNVKYSNGSPDTSKISFFKLNYSAYEKPKALNKQINVYPPPDKPVVEKQSKSKASNTNAVPNGVYEKSQKSVQQPPNTDLHSQVRDLVMNVIVPGIHDSLSVGLENMGNQIINHLQSSNGMYSNIVKKLNSLEKSLERFDRLESTLALLTSKVDEINKNLSVNIDTMSQTLDAKLAGKKFFYLELLKAGKYIEAFVLANQMDLDTGSDFTMFICENLDISTFFENDSLNLNQTIVIDSCAGKINKGNIALTNSLDRLEIRIPWITEFLSLIDINTHDYPKDRMKAVLPKFFNFFQEIKHCNVMRDKVRFATKLCSYLSKCH